MTAAATPNIAIIGAGFSGLCMGIKLMEAGINSFTIYEKADRVGGTWRDNTYPGVACDVPSHLYSYSFEAKPDWTKVFSPGGEIQDYIEHCADKYGMMPFIKFGEELASARYDDTTGKWQLDFTDSKTVEADFVVSGMGGLHIPSFPEVKGRDSFKGASFHTAAWDHDVDLNGKRVAVIGTAASALQLIPEIVDKVAHMDVYQRTPNWVMPRPDMSYTEERKELFRKHPWREKLHRLFIYCLFEMRFPMFRRDWFFSRRATRMAMKHLAAQVPDPKLRAKLTPNYPVGCKRILASDVFYPALQKPNVDLITDPIAEITPAGVKTADGTERPVDVIIYATGFKPFVIAGTDIRGKGGQAITDYFQTHGIRAHKTVAVPGFPNYFMLLGPNSGLGHNSIILIIEAQVNYILQAIKATIKRGAHTVEVKEAAADAFDVRIQEDLKGTVWAGHCSSWYQGADGRIYTLWPRGTVNFRRTLKKLDAENYVFT